MPCIKSKAVVLGKNGIAVNSVKTDLIISAMIKDNTRTPAKTIHQYCIIDCLNNHQLDMCSSPDCQLHPVRHGKRVTGMRFLKQIKLYCQNCGEGAKSVKSCPIDTCSLYKYRFGKNPDRIGSRPDMILKGRSWAKNNTVTSGLEILNQK